ncbi:MAG: putative rane protein [candidate division NC10 bacterium]|nr:putative rane protein [candidate division NC10 bacterium]
MTSKRRWLIGLLMVLLVSCVTVNIYFPAAAIQKAADQIVDDVRKAPEPAPEQTPEQKREQAPDKKSRLEWFRVVAIGATAAHAAAVDVNVSTPAIRALKASMAARFPQLQPLYGKGAVGETNNGLVVVRDTGALSLKEKADVNRLVSEENRDRTALYAEIIKANNIDMGQLPEVQKIFANSWRGKSAPGWWIQQDNGQWAKK